MLSCLQNGKSLYFALLFFIVASAAHAQSGRLGWLGIIHTIDVEHLSKADIRMAFDTVDLATLSPEELVLIDKTFGELERRWAVYNGENRVPKGYPAMSVYIGGLQSEDCARTVSEAILRIPGVKGIMQVDLDSKLIAFYYEESLTGRIERIALETLKNDLKDSGYLVLSTAEMYLPENRSRIDSVNQRTAEGNGPCKY